MYYKKNRILLKANQSLIKNVCSTKSNIQLKIFEMKKGNLELFKIYS